MVSFLLSSLFSSLPSSLNSKYERWVKKRIMVDMILSPSSIFALWYQPLPLPLPYGLFFASFPCLLFSSLNISSDTLELVEFLPPFLVTQWLLVC